MLLIHYVGFLNVRFSMGMFMKFLQTRCTRPLTMSVLTCINSEKKERKNKTFFFFFINSRI